MQEIYAEKIKYIIGTVTDTVYANYKNPLSPYCICDVFIQETNIDISQDKIRVIFHSTPPEKDQTYKFFGTVEISKKYGMSFKCDTYIRDIPINSAHVIEFLSSGLFKGIKRKRAEQIVETLGEDCLIKIVNSPEVLSQIKGIPQKTIATIQETIIENLGMQKIITKLHEWRISLNLAKKIFQLYGDASVQRIMENPYCLANTIRGISFKRADEIAEKINIRGTDNRRIKGAIEYALHEIYEHDGSTFAMKAYVIKKTGQILCNQDGMQYPPEVIDANLTELISADVNELEDFTTEIGQIRQIENRIYLARYHSYEQTIAEKLSLLCSFKTQLTEEDTDMLLDHFINIHRRLPFSLSDEQQIAIIESMRNNVLVITGGPGTGKSTIIKAILMLYNRFFEIYDFHQLLNKVVLLAPTGRAAKRMTEITEIPAQTIHHFLLNQQSDDKNIENRLFIIDEMSMMDISTMSRFLEQLHTGDRIILVGDKEQLPPIKAGNVFEDIIKSNAFPTIELDTTFRQQQHSMIIDLAATIRKGDISKKLIKTSDDVKWHPTTKDDIVKTIESEVFSILDRGIPFENIQIIAPIHRGEQGITNINKHMQNLLITQKIPSSHSFMETGYANKQYEFYVGDRVIQLKNDSNKDVLNGDLGMVIGILPASISVQNNEQTVEEPEKLIIDFGEKAVFYDKEELDELALAYCFSVHKSQGSEFSHVLLPISSSYTLMMNRNLLYTAITRAKKEVTIIGELNIFLKGLKEKPRQRFTFLKDILSSI
ncbi:ATP-dependent RecD-like DNA helicase [Bacillus cereus]|uniref:SF1B family DNA helicase RecD2 n=2 Tax=Bacillus cereus group TaxID=86661 RepID=UPI003B7AB8B2